MVGDDTYDPNTASVSQKRAYFENLSKARGEQKQLSSKKAGSAEEPCPLKKCTVKVEVLESANSEKPQTGLADVTVKLSGKPDQKTQAGVAEFKMLDPGPQTVEVQLGDLSEKYLLLESAPQTKSVGAGQVGNFNYEVERLAKLSASVKRCEKEDEFVDGIEVEIAGDRTGHQNKEPTANGEALTYDDLRPDNYTITCTLAGENEEGYKIDGEASVSVDLKSGTEEVVEFKIYPDPLPLYLKLSFLDPEAAERQLPESFPVQLVVVDGANIDATVDADGMLSTDGNAWVEVPRSIKGFTLNFQPAAGQFIVCEKRDGNPKTQELVLEDELAAKTDLGHRAFCLPSDAWTLKNSSWKVDAAATYKQDEYKFFDLEKSSSVVGSKGEPLKLLLDPQWLFCKFEYYDRFFCHSDHGDQSISIPPVMLKGVCKTRGGSSDSYEARSNWTIGGDEKSLVQSLPWIISRKDDGTDPLTDLNKDTVLEFGEANTYVVSEDAEKRKIEKLDPTGADEAKLKPGLERPKYYDLPTLWKSTNYYTRLNDGTNKFFDELTTDQIKTATDASKPMLFSLDDIVLIDGDSQDVKDKDGSNTVKDRSKKSRMTLFHLNPEEDYKVTIDAPRPNATYHSTTEFTEDVANKFRNVIVDVDPKTRAILFCSGLYDLYDKRTVESSIDFSKGQILGARAAKLHDDEISQRKTIDGWANADINAAYVCDGAGYCELHYLHYGAVSTTAVYGALITYWSGQFTIDATKGGTAADKKNYIQQGMENAMTRWNAKDYQLEQADDSETLIIKTFSLFEAKEFEEPANSGTFIQRGGEARCTVKVTHDVHAGSRCTSSMGKTTANLRKSGYADEDAGVGNDYDGSAVPARLTVAHELGHAAGLDDEYVYSVPGYSGITRYKQYYPGMPYRENASLMLQNRAIRLHHYWGRVNWINDGARAGSGARPAGGLHEFLSGNKFRLTYAPADKTKLKYQLIDPTDVAYFGDSKYRNIYKPAYQEQNYALGYNGRCDMVLYKLGDDEFSRALNGGPYKAILVVVSKISARFVQGGIGSWSSATEYKVGDLIKKGRTKYICKTEHTSTASFNTDKAANWIKSKDRGDWRGGRSYDIGDLVAERGSYFYCSEAHTAATFATDNANWAEINYRRAWASDQTYAALDMVKHNGKKYVCATEHDSSDLFATDAANWREVNVRGDWLTGTAYNRLDTVKESRKLYVCLSAHTGAGLKIHNDKWIKEIDENDSGAGWSNRNKKQWLADLNKDIETMLEGDDGNFKVERAGDVDFSKVYVRIRLQYEVVDAGQEATAGSHFELEVKRDSSGSFAPNGSKLKVGSGCNSKTIARYLYGHLSDSRFSRRRQELTSDLEKEELTKLSDWLKSQVTGTYTVKDIT
jgi:hypothetical protein